MDWPQVRGVPRFVADFDNLYGGDEFAQKSAAHELKGLRAYQSCNLPGLRTPMFSLIDYCGFRVIATSVLPLRKGSLVYGSCDAGTSSGHWQVLVLVPNAVPGVCVCVCVCVCACVRCRCLQTQAAPSSSRRRSSTS